MMNNPHHLQNETEVTCQHAARPVDQAELHAVFEASMTPPYSSPVDAVHLSVARGAEATIKQCSARIHSGTALHDGFITAPSFRQAAHY